MTGLGGLSFYVTVLISKILRFAQDDIVGMTAGESGGGDWSIVGGLVESGVTGLGTPVESGVTGGGGRVTGLGRGCCGGGL